MLTSFKTVSGADYDLFKLACPLYEELQGTVGCIVNSHFRKYGQTSQTILDLGIGTGDTSLAVLKHNPKTKILGVDSELRMIEEARRKIESIYGSGRVQYICAKAEDLLDLGVKNIDAVVSGLMLHNLLPELRKSIIGMIWQNLNPKGIFVLFDKICGEDPEIHSLNLAKELSAYSIFLERGRRDLFDYWLQHSIRDDQPDLRLHISEVLETMETKGFKGVEVMMRHSVYQIVVGYS